MKKIIIVAVTALLLVSCSKIKPEYKCHTCFYSNSLASEDFCGTDKELKKYLEYKESVKRPVKCN